MDKKTVTRLPYYLYTFTVPLQYNSFSIASIEKDKEYVMGLDGDLEWTKDNILEQTEFTTVCKDDADVNGKVDWIAELQNYLQGIRSKYPQFVCRLTNVYNETENEKNTDKNLLLSNEYLLSVENLVARNNERALEILRDEITVICNAISIMLAQYNSNKQLFQPKVIRDFRLNSVLSHLGQISFRNSLSIMQTQMITTGFFITRETMIWKTPPRKISERETEGQVFLWK